MPSLTSRWDDFLDEHPRVAAALAKAQHVLPPLNFITIHYAYFVVVCLVSSVIFYSSSDPAWSISYTDSLFLVVSAMTEAGLNTVNLSQMTTWQQVLLFLLIIFGSSIWVSIWTVLARKHVFEKRFDDIVRAERIRRLDRRGSALGLPMLRFLSFRKTQTTIPGDGTPVLQGTGTKIPTARPPHEGAHVQQADGTAPDAQGDEDGAVAGSRPVARRTASMPGMQDDDADLAVASPFAAVNASKEEEAAAANGTAAQPSPSAAPGGRIAFADDLHPNAADANTTGRASEPAHRLTRRPKRTRAADDDIDDETATTAGEKRAFNMHHFLTHRTVGRNAQFHDLSRVERAHLGGCEYRALKVLSVLVPLYFFLWQFLGCVALGAWISTNLPGPPLQNGINPWWLGVFNGASAFNNSGMSLLDANMIPFQGAYFVLLTMGLMILAGNTAYPVFLRLIIWTLLKVLCLTTADEACADLKDTLRFILQYPRRVYTNLFPARPTWWLVFMLVLLNSIDWVAFELLNLGNPTVESLPPTARVLDGLFQALAVRSGGFYVVSIPGLYIGLQILYVIMMYISVYPVVITMRHSNVYEERSLGIYADEPAMGDLEDQAGLADAGQGQGGGGAPLARTLSNTRSAAVSALGRVFTWQGVGVQSQQHAQHHHHHPHGHHHVGAHDGGGSSHHETRISFISQQVQGQLAHDIWWLVLAVLVISTIETSHFLADPVDYSVFNVIFEVVSAYGTVGISVGVPWAAYSFSGGWYTGSKLVLCAVMLRGRHRGLPVALDRAVRLPGERLYEDEEEDHRIRRSMTTGRRSLDA